MGQKERGKEKEKSVWLWLGEREREREREESVCRWINSEYVCVRKRYVLYILNRE